MCTVFCFLVARPNKARILLMETTLQCCPLVTNLTPLTRHQSLYHLVKWETKVESLWVLNALHACMHTHTFVFAVCVCMCLVFMFEHAHFHKCKMCICMSLFANIWTQFLTFASKLKHIYTYEKLPAFIKFLFQQEAKCLSTLWTNYMKGEAAVQT